MLCSRWFSLENLAYTAALIVVLLHGAHELRGEELREVIDEREHLLGECWFARRFRDPYRRRAHSFMVDLYYVQGLFADRLAISVG
ncbi:MAG: hypothetical protein U0263_03365 [Polyangiaceae bacterium]